LNSLVNVPADLFVRYNQSIRCAEGHKLMTKTIALLTDFGNDDSYVGVMKGVMRSIAPEAMFIDVSHTITPQGVRQAAFALMNAYRYFPQGTVFLVVVDPGVGSTRKPIAVRAGDYTFVAPDNGVLSYGLAHFQAFTAYELTNTQYQLPEVSRTFHGRDIFAPAAAYIASGIAPSAFGPVLETTVNLPSPMLDVDKATVKGEVVHVDRFGNIITSIGHLNWMNAERLTLSPAFGELPDVPIIAPEAQTNINDHVLTGIHQAYSDVRRGELVVISGSSGFLEISVNQGYAAQRLDVTVGDRVELAIGNVNAAIRD
jgi:S-adenosyl-L-methionine hydrolase (adenosine-forming)